MTCQLVCILESVCRSVADHEDCRLLALQRDTNLKSTMISVTLIFHFFLKFGLVLEKK